MLRPYYEFKQKRLGKRVDYDKRVGHQCVDLFKQYMDEVIGIKCKAVGSAKEIRKNTFKAFKTPMRQKHIGMNDLMQGDVICSDK